MMVALLALLLAVAGEPAPREAMSVEQAVEASLVASPELLDAVDQAASAEANLGGTRSLFLPQLSPFYSRTASRDGTASTTRFGALASQQFAFGPRLLGSIEASPSADGGYSSAYALSLAQPLLRGADPAVTREPLRAAERLRDSQLRSLVVQRRRTVVSAWGAYLDVALQEELVVVAREGVTRAEKLVQASEAKLQAGTLSRLDVLRGQQLAASARSQENDARNRRDDTHDALARLTGRPLGRRFDVAAPRGLPVPVPDEDAAIAHARANREELVEARERVKDAEVALRLAKSFVLPTLDAQAGVSAGGLAAGIFDALTTPGRPSYTLGFRSQANLNQGLLFGQKAQAEIALVTARRRAATLEEDVTRSVRQAYRRLATAREREAIEVANLEVATTQLDVASLRFQKGLSDNFHVVDAENLFNTARVSALTSRQGVLLAELDVLLQSALLAPEAFVRR